MTRDEIVAHYVKQWKESGEWELVRLACQMNGFEPTDEDITDSLMDIYIDIWQAEDAGLLDEEVSDG